MMSQMQRVFMAFIFADKCNSRSKQPSQPGPNLFLKITFNNVSTLQDKGMCVCMWLVSVGPDLPRSCVKIIEILWHMSKFNSNISQPKFPKSIQNLI